MKIENFMSFERQEFLFDDNGLILVCGEVVSSDSSNGAGKSALFEALVWCLYGKTIRDTSVNRVIRTGTSFCEVSVWFSVINGEESVLYNVCRRRTGSSGKVKIFKDNENDLTESSMADTDRKIVDIIGMSFDLFVNTVFYGQGLPYRFIQETDKGKKEVLEEILNLSWLDNVVKKLKSVQQIYNSMENNLELSISRLESEIDANVQFKSKFADVDDNKKVLLDELIDRRNSLLNEIKEKKSVVSEYRKMSIELSSKIAAVKAEINEENKRVAELQNNKNKFVGDVLECPLCFSDVSSEEAKERIFQEYSREINALLDRIDSDNREVELVSLDFQYLVDEVRKQEEVVSALEDEVNAIQLNISKIEADLRNYNIVVELDDKIKVLKDDLMRYHSTMERVKDNIKVIDFWYKAFGNTGIRTWIIERVLPYLNGRLNHYLDLFNTEFDLTFSLDDKGEKISSFVMRNNDLMDYSQLSGGEKRRLDVAVLLALGDLFQVRFQNQVSLRIFDEVCENLDAAGIEALMEILLEKSYSSGVYVISHSQDMPAFQKVVVVRKGLGGISSISSISEGAKNEKKI